MQRPPSDLPAPSGGGSKVRPVPAVAGGGRSREHRVVDAFTDLTGALVRGEDVLGLLDLLTVRCADLLDVESAGLLLADRDGDLHVLAASSPEARHLETLQTQGVEGPCQDCFVTGRPVLVPDLGDHAERWPTFVPAALQAGVRSAHAVPMRLGGRTLGALGLFGSKAGSLQERDLTLAQGLADVASIALTHDRGEADVTARLQAALEGRLVVEQAKGFVAQSGGLDAAQAHDALRRFARDRGRDLAGVARAVMARELPPAALLVDGDARP